MEPVQFARYSARVVPLDGNEFNIPPCGFRDLIASVRKALNLEDLIYVKALGVRKKSVLLSQQHVYDVLKRHGTKTFKFDCMCKGHVNPEFELYITRH